MNSHFFNQGFNIPKIPAFFCTPKTEVGKKFRDLYGEVYTVKRAGKNGNNPFVVVNNGCGKELEVEKRPDGIFVDGEFFADDWELKEIEDES